MSNKLKENPNRHNFCWDNDDDDILQDLETVTCIKRNLQEICEGKNKACVNLSPIDYALSNVKSNNLTFLLDNDNNIIEDLTEAANMYDDSMHIFLENDVELSPIEIAIFKPPEKPKQFVQTTAQSPPPDEHKEQEGCSKWGLSSSAKQSTGFSTIQDLIVADQEHNMKPVMKQEASYNSPPGTIQKTKDSGKQHEPKRMSMNQLENTAVLTGRILSYRKILYYHCDQDFYIPLDSNDAIALLRRYLPADELNLHSMHSLEDSYRYLLSDERIRIDTLPDYSGCAACANGFFDFNTGKVYPYSPQIINFSKINANFRPDENLYTPVFDTLLDDISGGDSSVRQRTKEFMGTCMMIPDRSNKTIFICGCADYSAKTQIGNFLRKLYPDGTTTSISIQEMNNDFGLMNIISKSLIVSMDLPDETLKPKAVSLLKMLSGDDSISINRKFKDYVEYDGNLHLIFGTNHPIRISGIDDAFWKRVVLIPFDYTTPPEKRDIKLFDKLWHERDGILTTCLIAANQCRKDGKFCYTEVESAKQRIQQWAGNSDSIGEFINSCCELKSEYSNDDGTIKWHETSDSLYSSYESFCDKHNMPQCGRNTFTTQLKKLYSLSRDRWRDGTGDNPRGLKGIRLKKQN